MLNGNVVKSSERIKITESGETYKIDISEVLMADHGEWSFCAKNRLGEKKLVANLEVIGKKLDFSKRFLITNCVSYSLQ